MKKTLIGIGLISCFSSSIAFAKVSRLSQISKAHIKIVKCSLKLISNYYEADLDDVFYDQALEQVKDANPLREELLKHKKKYKYDSSFYQEYLKDNSLGIMDLEEKQVQQQVSKIKYQDLIDNNLKAYISNMFDQMYRHRVDVAELQKIINDCELVDQYALEDYQVNRETSNNYNEIIDKITNPTLTCTRRNLHVNAGILLGAGVGVGSLHCAGNSGERFITFSPSVSVGMALGLNIHFTREYEKFHDNEFDKGFDINLYSTMRDAYVVDGSTYNTDHCPSSGSCWFDRYGEVEGWSTGLGYSSQFELHVDLKILPLPRNYGVLVNQIFGLNRRGHEEN